MGNRCFLHDIQQVSTQCVHPFERVSSKLKYKRKTNIETNQKKKQYRVIADHVFCCCTWINGFFLCVYSEPSAVQFHWQSRDCWSWWHAMVMHTEMALWHLWSSFDSSNCSSSRVKIGLSLALSYNKKHLEWILMNKNATSKGRLLQDKPLTSWQSAILII